jgi:hypothetical protein
VERFWKRRDERVNLESELRAHRPVARAEFVQAIGDRVRASRRSQSTFRIAFAGALTVLMLVALGAFGGFGYAAAGAGHAAATAKNAFKSNGPSAEHNSPSKDQYKTTICHRTHSRTNPWVEITVSNNALPAHEEHGDIIPAPAGGCPTS